MRPRRSLLGLTAALAILAALCVALPAGPEGATKTSRPSAFGPRGLLAHSRAALTTEEAPTSSPGTIASSGVASSGANGTIAPYPGSFGSMVYDASDGYVVAWAPLGDNAQFQYIVQGNGCPCVITNETWFYQSGSWKQLLIPGPAEAIAPLAYDASDHYVMTVAADGNTWMFHAGKWSVVKSCSFTGCIYAGEPRESFLSSLVYDAHDGYVLAFGGCSVDPDANGCAGVSNQTWKYHAGTWTQLHPTMYPGGRYSPSMTYDPSVGKVILFGGGGGDQVDCTASGPPCYPSCGGYFGHCADTWTYQSGVWTNVTNVSPTHPSGRFGAGFANDTKDGYDVLFGGSTSGAFGINADSFVGDTWTFHAGLWTNITAGTHPPAREGSPLVYDPRDGYTVLFGGDNNTGYYGATGSEFGDTWKFAAGGWHIVLLHASPSPRWGSADLSGFSGLTGVYVPGGLFGGRNTTTVFGDTWVYLGSGYWHELFPKAHPVARYAAAAQSIDVGAYGPSSVVVGGRTSGGTALADSWLFNATGWHSIAPATSPPARYSAALASGGSYVILFGGMSSTGANLADTWGLHFVSGKWQWVHFSAPGPSARHSAAFLNNASANTFVLFGGYSTTFLGDTWVFNATAATWKHLSPASAPGARSGSTVLGPLFGGSNGKPLNDTWRWTGSNWVQLFPPHLPPPRQMGAGLANGVLFGGWNGSVALSDTWELKLVSGHWLWVDFPEY